MLRSVHMSWPRAKYFPFRYDQTHSISIYYPVLVILLSLSFLWLDCKWFNGTPTKYDESWKLLDLKSEKILIAWFMLSVCWGAIAKSEKNHSISINWSQTPSASVWPKNMNASKALVFYLLVWSWLNQTERICPETKNNFCMKTATSITTYTQVI